MASRFRVKKMNANVHLTQTGRVDCHASLSAAGQCDGVSRSAGESGIREDLCGSTPFISLPKL